MDVDTSSYPKASALPAQKSLLDQAGQYQTLESQNIAIGKQKLDLINQRWGLMRDELATLADTPNMSKEEAAKRLTTFATTHEFPPAVTQHMLGELQASPDVATFGRLNVLRGQSNVDKANQIYQGQLVPYDNGQQSGYSRFSPMKGISSGGLPTQKQVPVNQPTFDENNRPILQGPTAPVTPPGTVAYPGAPSLPVRRVPTQSFQPTPIPQPRPLPVAQPPGNLPPNFRSGLSQDSPNNVVAQRNPYPAPSGPPAGTSPLFEEGKRAYTEDQANASARMMRAKPAIQALPLMQTKGFLAGPGSEQFTHAVAALKTAGLISTANENDPTAIRQEVTKKLAQYVSGNPVGQRSDASQTLAEASSPNPKTQILPALIKLTKDAIILDRVEAARPNAFKGQNFEQYGKHRATFPQSIDEKAFGLDMEPNSEKIVDNMAKQLQSKDKKEKAGAEKFFKSLRIAKEQGYYQ